MSNQAEAAFYKDDDSIKTMDNSCIQESFIATTKTNAYILKLAQSLISNFKEYEVVLVGSK